MTRPRYENSSHRIAEKEFQSDIEGLTGCELRKLDWRKYGWDFAMFDGDHLVRWVEMKCRAFKMGTFPDYMISSYKWAKGVNLLLATSRPISLAVRLLDNDYWFHYGIPEHGLMTLRLGWGGRTDRGDPFDMEPMIYIPFEHFEPMYPVESRSSCDIG